MDLSQFKPPVRLSMSDEEIYQALGSAQASEDGIAKAMAIVEEQANLREHDNKLFAEWVARMQSSTEPEAKIALENVERAKQGLEALTLTAPTNDLAAALNAAHEVQDVVVDEVVPEALVEPEEEILEPVAEEEQLQSIFANLEPEPVIEPEPEVEPEVEAEADSFEALLADAANEATSSITVNNASEQPAVTFEADEPEVENFDVSADEDALVTEERQRTSTKSGWWSNASFWVLISGVFLPVVAAYLVGAAGFGFGTALAGFGLGLLVNLGVIVSAHFTAQRTHEPQVVTTRATFGVLGAIVPGLFAIGFAIAALNLSAIGITASFDGVFDTGINFGDELLNGFTYSSLIPVAMVVVALLIAGFASRAIRWINAVGASLLLLAFVVTAVVSRDLIRFEGLDFSFDLLGVGLIASAVSCIGIAFYGKAPKVSATKSTVKTTLRWSALVTASMILPIAVFAHFVLVFQQTQPAGGFALLHNLGLSAMPNLAAPILWVAAASLIVLLVNLGHIVLTQLRAFGLNQISGWFSIVASLSSTSLFVLPTWASWLDIVQLLLIPVGVGAGFALADSLLRRGSYHEASLLRGYGFYGKFNLVAVIGYLAIAAGGYAISQPLVSAPWLGFAGWTTPFAPLAAFAAAAVWSAATGVPRILVQQREVAEVELRKASLSEFTGFSE